MRADPAGVQHAHVTIDALAPADVLPFWRALLGYREVGGDFLFDPAGRGPCVEFQQLDACRRNAAGSTSTSQSRTRSMTTG